MLRIKPNCLYKSLYTYSTSCINDYLHAQINYFLFNKITNKQSLLQSHAYIITSGHKDNIFIAAKLISLYASFNQSNSSAKVFNLVKFKDPFLWNSIIKAHYSNGLYAQALEFYTQMSVSNILPNEFTVPMVVSACAELGVLFFGKKIHGLVSKINLFESNAAIGASFVYMYSKNGCMDDAGLVFDEMCVKDLVSWTALVIGYVQNDECEKGLEVLCEMHKVGGYEERPNFRTLEGGFLACGNLGAMFEGKCLHGLAVKSGIGCYESVLSSIFSMYCKFGTCEETYISFSEVFSKDLMSWTSIIGVYARVGCFRDCLGLFFEMRNAGIDPDGMIISCMLSGFGNSTSVLAGKAFHAFIIRADYKNDKMVHNALVSMYCKFGLVALAEKFVDGISERDDEVCNLMVQGYFKVGRLAKCLELFREMQLVGIQSNLNTLVSVISSCAELRAIYQGRHLHCYVIKNVMDENISVANSLIDMYGKVGQLSKAWNVFNRSHRDTVTWNTLISLYAHSGHYAESLSLYDRMVAEGIKPNSATLVIVLSACSHIASLEKGESIYTYIKKEKLELNLPLATALVDMYAKCGKFDISRDIFNSVKQKDVVLWNAMILGYGMHGDAKSALELLSEMEQSDVTPNELTFLSGLIACNHAGLVEEGKNIFGRMKDYFFRPTLKHYTCMVDLLARSGDLHEAEALALSMPIAADGGLWGALLSACKIHNNAEMGIRIAKHAIDLDPDNDGYYIIISDLYNSLGMGEEAERMRMIMKKKGLRKKAGWSMV
ncbi:Pentatricopeptide repeat-containing protein [Heracleum sosnowskyi]|uniref:Pentatricopeptide repeat-containing protein n=1 Tax=Heracleum sosnowskyi TaxID=360622 RepID=A0AAD8HQG5_9APIA|nr:Pentatricopeptide repeat-containing protein [Heracleum sosnowskyi]